MCLFRSVAFALLKQVSSSVYTQMECALASLACVGSESTIHYTHRHDWLIHAAHLAAHLCRDDGTVSDVTVQHIMIWEHVPTVVSALTYCVYHEIG
jgi:hypothetical protein